MGLYQNVKQTLAGLIFSQTLDGSGTPIGSNGTGASLNVYQTNMSSAPAVTGATVTTLSITTSSQEVLPANPDRRGFSVYSQVTGGFSYLAMGSAAATGSFTVALETNGFYEAKGDINSIYTGAINVIGDTGTTGTLYITEYSL